MIRRIFIAVLALSPMWGSTTRHKRPDELERRRRFYRLTPLGRKAFELEISRMKAVLRRVRLSRLQPAEQDGR